MAQSEQAKEHDEKENDVCCRHGNERESVTQRDVKTTEDVFRVPLRAMLRDKIRKRV